MKIIVIGAGASGLMCAYHLKKNGHDVLLIDKNEKVGKKIYITGKGRCNLTNNCSKEEFFNSVINNSKFLYPAYNAFTPQMTIDFFENIGVPLVTERGKRVFPISYQASDIAESLYKINKNTGVEIKLNEAVINVTKNENSFSIITTRANYICDKVVIATGGLSYPSTGSTGDGYKFAEIFGHNVVPQVPALCAFKIKEEIPEELQRFTFKNVTLRILGPNFKKEEFGELTFYKEGVAGATALTLSSLVNRLPQNKLSLEIDFKPSLSYEKLDARLLREIKDTNNKNVLDLLKKLLPNPIISWFCELNNIDSNLGLKDLKKEIRLKILKSLKSFELTYDGLDDIKRATVTSGGVSTKEINPRTMESKLIPGLYFIGEVIDVDAFTGGFNLQIAFSTAILAAQNIDR